MYTHDVRANLYQPKICMVYTYNIREGARLCLCALGSCDGEKERERG